MASGFVVADNDVIEDLKKWVALKNIGEGTETYEVQELDKFKINLRIHFCPL